MAPQPLIEVLEPSSLLNLLRIPHFERSTEVTTVVKILLSCMHEGFLWLAKKVDLNVHLIHRITGLSKRGTDPTNHFVGKELDRQIAERMKRPYNLQKGGRAFDAAIIEDDTVWFTIQLLAGCLLHTFHTTEVPATVVDLAHCVKEGVEYNWSLYLLN